MVLIKMSEEMEKLKFGNENFHFLASLYLPHLFIWKWEGEGRLGIKISQKEHLWNGSKISKIWRGFLLILIINVYNRFK